MRQHILETLGRGWALAAMSMPGLSSIGVCVRLPGDIALFPAISPFTVSTINCLISVPPSIIVVDSASTQRSPLMTITSSCYRLANIAAGNNQAPRFSAVSPFTVSTINCLIGVPPGCHVSYATLCLYRDCR